MARSRGNAFTLLATMKNEAPFLLEWLAYHKVIGFTRFVIFSNDSTDGTTELLSALHDAGEITHIYHEPTDDVAIVHTVSEKAMSSGLLQTGDWVMWLDADEFLNVHVGGNTVSDLAHFVAAKEKVQGICISWRVFGTGGNSIFRGRFLSDDYDRCQEELGGRTNDKTLFLFDQHTQAVLNHKPLMIPRFWEEGRTFIGSNGDRMLDTDRYVRKWRNGRVPGRISREYTSWYIAQINHYAVRTRALTDLKGERGRIAKAKMLGKKRYGGLYFKTFNQNTGEDRSILRWEKDVLEEYYALIEKVSGAFDYFALIQRNYEYPIVDLRGFERDYEQVRSGRTRAITT